MHFLGFLRDDPAMDPRDLTLGLVAGGRGLRLGGVAKGLIEVEGETVLARLLRLRPAADRVLLSVNDPSLYAAYSLEAVPDVVSGAGAPGGVVSLLLAARTPWAFVVACDMPWVGFEALAALAAAVTPEVDVVAFERDGGLEPLCALIRSSLGASWRAQLAARPSLRGLMAESGLARLSPADPRWLDSVNTPDDLQRAGGKLPPR